MNWMRCSHGQIWNATAGDCTGTGSSTSYFGAQIFKYCSLQDNSCNDANPLGEDSTVLGHLDGGGTSEAWNACQSLNAGSGTYGITTWRVPRKSELTGILYCSNGSTIPPNCNSGSSSPTIDTVMFPNTVVGTGVLGKYWTSSADFTQDPFFAWYVDFNTGILNAWGKNNSLNVRCVSTTGP
ncbi:MAG: DUF1566 domain-containing protein [Spirochaetia bacterium]|nr:DUF1566 domain-containing protein [Spirochaetia bacterium]